MVTYSRCWAAESRSWVRSWICRWKDLKVRQIMKNSWKFQVEEQSISYSYPRIRGTETGTSASPESLSGVYLAAELGTMQMHLPRGFPERVCLFRSSAQIAGKSFHVCLLRGKTQLRHDDARLSYSIAELARREWLCLNMDTHCGAYSCLLCKIEPR